MTLAGSIGGSVALFFGATLASAAGIGGGGVTLPILIAIFGFEFTTAVVLSLCAVLGNILSQFWLNFRARHPENFSKPLIYWEAVMIMLPAQLAGSSVGVLLSEMAPKTVLEILAIMTIIFAATKTLLKGMTRYQLETEALLEKGRTVSADKGLLTSSPTVDITAPLLVDSDCRPNRGSSSRSVPDELEVMATQSYDRAITASIQDTALQYPWTIIITLVSLWVINASLLISMTTYGDCSLEYYMLLAATFPLLLGVCVGGFAYVIQ